jgi:hypothetical protein
VCCGQNRTQLRTAESTPQQTSGQPTSPSQKRTVPVRFTYVGTTGITVSGPVSGLRYRFDRPAAIVEVDPRDRKMLASLPQLRQVT